MAQPQDHISMALFCDFENVALGVRDANYEKFDIKRVLERLLLKGSIVVKKAYCDWDRYKSFKAAMHEANFELIEIPHVRQSGKNSADIRLVVDALDLCYTKSHVNTFVIISGDSDFSPLVSKLRENAKYVIGVGVKQSTSDLLIANCDEFIFYDDLVRESQRQRRDSRDQQPQQRRSPEEEKRRREEMDARRTKVVEMAAETYEALVTDRDEGGRVWASVLKEALKRRNPGFSEQYYGFRTFGNLLEEAQARGLLELGRDEKSGLFVSRGTGVPTRAEAALAISQPLMQEGSGLTEGDGALPPSYEAAEVGEDAVVTIEVMEPRPLTADAVASDLAHADEQDAPRGRGRGRQRGGRKTAGQNGGRDAERGAERGAERNAERPAQWTATSTGDAVADLLADFMAEDSTDELPADVEASERQDTADHSAADAAPGREGAKRGGKGTGKPGGKTAGKRAGRTRTRREAEGTEAPTGADATASAAPASESPQHAATSADQGDQGDHGHQGDQGDQGDADRPARKTASRGGSAGGRRARKPAAKKTAG